MKKLSYIFIFIFLWSCSSNTIFEKPKDLIPRDTMSLLIHDMYIAQSTKYFKNVNNQKGIEYMPFVYDKYKIDSTRFQNSNFYYTTKIDLYEEIIDDARKKLEEKKEYFSSLQKRKDSLRKDSIENSKVSLKELDTVDLPTKK